MLSEDGLPEIIRSPQAAPFSAKLVMAAGFRGTSIYKHLGSLG